MAIVLSMVSAARPESSAIWWLASKSKTALVAGQRTAASSMLSTEGKGQRSRSSCHARSALNTFDGDKVD
jgi:hypothetical protein